MNQDSYDKEICCGPDEVKARLWEIIRTAKYKEELCNSDGDVITAWYMPVVDGNLAMLLVDKLVENGVTFKDKNIVYTKRGLHLGHRHYCYNCGQLSYMEDYCSRCGAKVHEKDELVPGG